MRRTMLGACASWLLATATMVGCAESQPPVNRVQPNAVAKSTFEGEFYFQQTVIDTPYSTGFTFVGEQGTLQKITWEIQEQFLVARRSYEWIAGSEGQGVAGTWTERGAPVAMFAIQRHFDIRREYNPLTGEETNVITENDQDRPWNEREYVRVDWSRNLMADSDFLSLSRLFDGVDVEPMAWFANDPNDPRAPQFIKDEDGNTQYIDIVNKMFATPSGIDIPGWGFIPSCYLYYTDHLDCQPSEITVRNSFLRVDPNRDYEPNVYSGDRMERAGYFVSERAGYNLEYGVVDAERVRFNNRHNIWKKAHRAVPQVADLNYDENADGVNDYDVNQDGFLDCTSDERCSEGVFGQIGSRCDTARAIARREPTGACTIPYREREVRVIPYHLSANTPEQLLPDAEHLENEWNSAFLETVGSLRFNECMEELNDQAACAPERERETTIFTICHNPVLETDNPACGPAGTSAQIGDLRYSMIPWVSEPHLSSPLGYGPSTADPETGEIIQANAFIYGAAVETLGSFARDILLLLNGNLSVDDVSSGVNVTQWAQREAQQNRGDRSGRPADDHVVAIDGFDVPNLAKAMTSPRAGMQPAGRRGRPSSPGETLERLSQAQDRLSRMGVFGNGTDLTARLQNLRGTDIEAMMTTPDMRAAAGFDPSAALSDDMLDAASPLRRMNPAAIRSLRAYRDRLQKEACVLNTDFADQGLLGLARAVKAAIDTNNGILSFYGRDYDISNDAGELDEAALRRAIIHPLYDAVTAHEIGHTLGLRHNFSGSYDSINYNPRYWELRDDGNMQSRAWDAESEEETAGRIREFQYSTVMDYGNNFVVTDSEGIGHYDRYAIKLGYGDLVEVFDNIRDRTEVVWWSMFQSWGWPFITTFDSATGGEFDTYQYTDIIDVVGSRNNLQSRADVPYTSLKADPSYPDWASEYLTVDQRNRPAVPYLFCSDEQADLGPDCMRYDAGADAYETLQSLIDTYWNYYVFAAFRRQRIGFNVESYYDRILSRYFEKLQSANQLLALYRPIIADVFDLAEDDPSWTTRQNGLAAYTAGVGASYGLFTRVLTTPEPGTYGTGTRPDGTTAMLPDGTALNLGILDGRSIETTWDFDNQGYFWFGQIARAGFFYDKALAIMVLTDPTTYFVGRDTSADIRQYQLNFYSTFGPSLTAFFRGLLSENWAAIAPRQKTTGDLTTGALVYPTPDQFVTGEIEGDPVDPNASFSIQLYSALYSTWLIPQTYDQTYLNSARIYVRGGAESVEIDGPKVEFTDDTSGLTYVAASRIEDGEETGVGARMLMHAQALSDRGETVELRKFMDNVNIMRRLSWELGFGVL